jgi:hypothetical protein
MGDFLANVRNSRVQQPTQRGYCRDKWDDAFQRHAPHDEADRHLYEAGKWFFAKFCAIRQELQKHDLSLLKREDLTRACVAVVNHTCTKIGRLPLAPNHPGPLWAEEMAQGRYESAASTNQIRSDECIVQCVDGLSHSLRYAMERGDGAPGSPARDPKALIKSVETVLSLGNFYDVLENLWSDALWHSWHIFQSNGVSVLAPPADFRTTESAVSDYRHNLILLQITLSSVQQWQALPLFIKQEASRRFRVELGRSGKHRTYRVDMVTDVQETPPMPLLHRMMAEQKYFAHLQQTPFPKLPNGSLGKLVKVWELIYALCEAQAKRFPSCDELSTMNMLWQFAPLTPKKVLSDLIQRNIVGFTPDTATAIVQFLTFKAERNSSAWVTPLVDVDGDHVVLAIPAILHGNLLRTCDRWLKMGGVDVQSKGTAFESEVRRSLEESIQKSSHLKNCGICPNDVTINAGGKSEEVDVVMWIGRTVLMGEVKCMNVPAEPLEKNHYYSVLNDAAGQIGRKCKFIETHVNALCEKLGWRTPPRRIVPFVLVNQPFGVGYERLGIPIVDLYSLKSYLEWGEIREGVSFHIKHGVTGPVAVRRYYETEDDAENRIQAYLQKPPPIADYEKCVQTRTYRWPLINESDCPTAIQRAEVSFKQQGTQPIPEPWPTEDPLTSK